MGSILRFLALAGVISVGSYMLYQAETRLSESENLSQSDASKEAHVSLGESSVEQVPMLDEDAPMQFEPDVSSHLIDGPADSATDAFGREENQNTSSQDFNAAKVTTADGSTNNGDPFNSIQLASDELPLTDDAPETSADEFPEFEPLPPRESRSDPFGENSDQETPDPFGEFPTLDSTDKPTENKPDATPALNVPLPEEFPALEKKELNSPDPFGDAPPELPEPTELSKPVTEPDPFAPLPSDPKPVLEVPASEADPFSNTSAPNEPNPFEEADKSKAVKTDESNKDEFYPIITPLRSTQKKSEDPFGSLPRPKITPKPTSQPAPFEGDHQLPRITPARNQPTSESNPFSLDGLNSEISPASAEGELPIITPRKKPEEFDPFTSGSPAPKEPPEFPGVPELTPSPEPTRLEESFPLPEPLPATSTGTATEVEKPTPAPDAFPAVEEPPPVNTPEVSDPFGESRTPVKTGETPVDDSFQFPPLPKATPDDAPSALKTSADEFPALEPIEKPAVTTTSPPLKESDTKPFPDSPFPDLEESVKKSNELPDITPEPALSDVKEPTVPKELKNPEISKPIEPRAVPLPQLVIEKLAPEKAVLQQPFVYHILIKNTGTTSVGQVTVQDQVPRGTKLSGTIPQAELTGQRLVWKLDRMLPGEEKKISVKVIPEQAGPIGSVATVNYVAEVGSETVIELPKIEFRMVLPSDARMGEIVTCRFDIENKGDQTITGMTLRDVLPEGLYHPSGQDLENPLGDLKPGDRIVEQLQLKVTKTGEIVNTAYLAAEGGLRLETSARLEAKSNRLVITRRGPKHRTVGSEAVYHNVVKNISEKPVSDALVIEQLPQGMEFVSASANGEFHSKGRTIFWKLPTLQPGQSIVLLSKVIPQVPGTQESLVRVVESSSSQSEIKAVSHTEVKPVEAIGLVMSEHREPVQIGDSVLMTIEATNRGQKSAENVRIRAAIPPSLSLMNVRGETRFRIEGREVVFEPLNVIEPGNKETIQLELKAAASSTAKVSVTIQSDKMRQPIQQASALSIEQAVR